MIAQIVWHAPQLLPLAVLVAAVAVAVVALFYVPQARRLPQPWRFGLPVLRLAVGLALAASVARPVLVRSASGEDPGAIVLLVDASRSMTVTDPRGPAERVALAEAVGALPAGARSLVAPGLREELAALTKRLDALGAARADVEYAELSGQGMIAAQARYEELSAQVSALAGGLSRRGQGIPGPSDLATKLEALGAPDAARAATTPEYRRGIVAALASMNAAQAAADTALYARPDVKQISDEIASLSRAQLADRATSRAAGSVLAPLAATGIYRYAFAETARPAPETGAASHPSADPTGLASDVTGALLAVAEQMKGRPVRAIVLLSDGRQVGSQGGDAGAGIASSLSEAGVPVYAVAVGTPAPPDLSVAQVTVPARQFTGETTTARVQLRGTGMKGRAVEVVLEAGGKRQGRSVTLTDRDATLDFPLTLGAAGVHDVVVTAAPVAGEVTESNNVARRRIVATADRASVALVGASASWDFQHLRRLLSGASWARVDAEVLDAPGARWSVPPSDVAERSLVILSNVAAEHLAPRQWDALYQLVAERGATVLFLAGRNTSAPETIDSPLLTDLLPFRAGTRPTWRVWPGERPLFRFRPAADAASGGPLALAEGVDGSVGRWLELPAVFQYLPVADVKPNTAPLLFERDSGLAVLTESRLGLGRVLFFGVNETWRWRAGSGAADHDRFWRQLVRHAVEAPYAVRAAPLRLDADRVAVRPGESVRVAAKVDLPQGATTPPDTLALRVTRDAGPASEVTMTRDAAAAGRYTAVVNGLSAGVYDLRLANPHGGPAVASLPLYVEQTPEAEMRDVSGDERTLRRLAESTGGAFLTLDEWDTLPSLLRAARDTNARVREERLWDSPLLFAFVLGCLGLEWAMRKRLGLA